MAALDARRPDGTRDTTTRVRWLQGLCAYVDLRQPAAMNDFSHVRCLADLTMDDCACLATQQGLPSSHLRRHAFRMAAIDRLSTQVA